MFGPHLTLDLYGCNRRKLSDIEFVNKLLDVMPGNIGMTKIMPPHCFWYDGKRESFDKGGVSGFVIISESHISIHTFPEQRYASVDIFSCKQFDIDRTAELFAQALEARKIEKNLIMRGREFPHSVPQVTKIVTKQREGMKE